MLYHNYEQPLYHNYVQTTSSIYIRTIPIPNTTLERIKIKDSLSLASPPFSFLVPFLLRLIMNSPEFPHKPPQPPSPPLVNSQSKFDA